MVKIIVTFIFLGILFLFLFLLLFNFILFMGTSGAEYLIEKYKAEEEAKQPKIVSKKLIIYDKGKKTVIEEKWDGERDTI